MPVGGQSPTYEFNTIGIGKESTFATVATPTLWIPTSEITPSPKNAPLELPGARGRIGQSYPLTGRYTNGLTMTAEGSPDVLNAILALAMGVEAVVPNANNPGSGSPVLGYDHTFTLGPLAGRSFTVQHNRVTDAINYIGNMISQLRLGISPDAILLPQITTQCARESLNASPNSAMFGSADPFRFQDQGNYFKLNNTAGAIDVKSFDLQLATGIMPGDPTFGGGRFDSAYNQGQAKVTLTVTLKFNTQAAYKLFLGNSGATSPQNAMTPCSIDIYFGGPAINTAVNYGLRLLMAKCFVTATGVPGRSGGVLEQTFEVMPAETVNGGGDDLKAILTNTASTAF